MLSPAYVAILNEAQALYKEYEYSHDVDVDGDYFDKTRALDCAWDDYHHYQKRYEKNDLVVIDKPISDAGRIVLTASLTDEGIMAQIALSCGLCWDATSQLPHVRENINGVKALLKCQRIEENRLHEKIDEIAIWRAVLEKHWPELAEKYDEDLGNLIIDLDIYILGANLVGGYYEC